MRAPDATRPEPGTFGGWTRRCRFIAAVPLPWRFRREEKMQRILISLGLAGLILGAAYALWLYRKIIFGEITKDSLKAILDIVPGFYE